MRKNINVLIVDDDLTDCALYASWLNEHTADVNYTVTLTHTVGMARMALHKARPDCIVLDYMLPDGRGTEMIAESLEQYGVPIVFITGSDDQEVKEQALSHGVQAFLHKNEMNSDNLHQYVLDACGALPA